MILWRKFDQYRAGTDFLRWAYVIAHYEVMKAANSGPVTGGCSATTSWGCWRPGCSLVRTNVNAPTGPGRLHGQAARRTASCCSAGTSGTPTTRDVAAATGRSVGGTRKTLHRIRGALADRTRNLGTGRRTMNESNGQFDSWGNWRPHFATARSRPSRPPAWSCWWANRMPRSSTSWTTCTSTVRCVHGANNRRATTLAACRSTRLQISSTAAFARPAAAVNRWSTRSWPPASCWP